MTGMAGKTVVITGASDGIGLQTALQLAAMGAELHLVGRNPDKLKRAAASVAAGGKVPKTYTADLSQRAQIHGLAQELLAACPRIDVLINNAGGIFQNRERSADGIEMTLALNHLGYFLLTGLLLDRLKASAPARIVSVASGLHVNGTLDFQDLQFERGYTGMKAYARSKLCNVLFTAALAKRLEGSGVTANCLHPGFVASNFGAETRGLFGLAFSALKRLAAISPEKGARTPVYLASSPDVAHVTGRYFVDAKPAAPSKLAQNARLAEELWQTSERLSGIDP